MISIIRANKATTFNRIVSSVLVTLLAGVHPATIVSVLATTPTGEQVISGDVAFVRDGSTLTITQTSQHAIINWQDFSISQGSLTQFIQNNANSASLNRVTSLTPSLIAGTLQANGRVILINPNGIAVSSSGIINTASFLASTLDVSNDDFLNGGDLNFIGNSSAGITNLGSIVGNDGVFLFAQQIDNAGSIVSGNQVGLASGSNILLKPAGDDARVSVLVGTSSDTTLDGDAIRNTGEVQAAMVTFKATGSAYATAVNNAGIIRAQGSETVNGRVLLTGGSTGTVLSSGTIAAKNADGTGGYVAITGDHVGLTGNAVVDVSGENGGGTALIGGSYQGKADASVQNASRTYVGKDVQIKADAGTSGNGGQVVVWANDQTKFYGDISAQAKGLSGNGGSVEVSGKQVLDFQGTVSTASLGGIQGTLLLDPDDLVITDAAATTGTQDTQLATGNDILFGDANIGGNTVSRGQIEALASGSNIILQANNTITVNDMAANAITLTNNSNITLQTTTGAISFTDVNDVIIASGTGTITIIAGGSANVGGLTTAGQAINVTGGTGVVLGGNINAGAGNVGLIATVGNITHTGGTITAATLTASAMGAGGGIGTSGNNVLTSVNTIIADADTGGIFVTETSGVDLDLSTVGAGAIQVTNTAGNLTVSGGTVVTGGGNITLLTDDIGLTGAVGAGAGTVSIAQITATRAIDVGTDTVGSLSLTDGEIDLITANVLQIGDAASGNLSVTAAITPAAATNLRLTSGGSISVGSTINTGAGNLRLTSATGTTQSAVITATGLATSGAGSVVLNQNNVFTNFASNTTNDVSVTATGNVTITTVGGITGVNLGANDFTIALAAGALSQANAITATDVTITAAGAGNGIDLSNVNNAISGVFTATAMGAGADLVLINTANTSLGNIQIADTSSITSVNGSISQAVGTTLDITSNAAFVTSTSGQSITLNNTLNALSGNVAFTTSGAAGSVTLRNNETITLGTSTVGGALTVLQENAGAFIITQAGASVLTVGGVASFDNNSTVTGDVAVTNTTTTNFGAGDSIVSGDLTITSTGAVTQTGA
ncbi:MAG TPA: filamentous hemagglutinin N-terminal domain-containing protein, partial [Roseimicrobium sp.]|nr:filamentous hemagglutinin N-terminal domain-containing protein [Roseimicrobium sp.]